MWLFLIKITEFKKIVMKDVVTLTWYFLLLLMLYLESCTLLEKLTLENNYARKWNLSWPCLYYTNVYKNILIVNAYSMILAQRFKNHYEKPWEFFYLKCLPIMNVLLEYLMPISTYSKVLATWQCKLDLSYLEPTQCRELIPSNCPRRASCTLNRYIRVQTHK